MRKLKLHLEELCVETLYMAPEGPDAARTVLGNIGKDPIDDDSTATAQCCLPPPTNEASCWGSCVNTCAASCQITCELSCGAPSPTCLGSCYPQGRCAPPLD